MISVLLNALQTYRVNRILKQTTVVSESLRKLILALAVLVMGLTQLNSCVVAGDSQGGLGTEEEPVWIRSTDALHQVKPCQKSLISFRLYLTSKGAMRITKMEDYLLEFGIGKLLSAESSRFFLRLD